MVLPPRRRHARRLGDARAGRAVRLQMRDDDDDDDALSDEASAVDDEAGGPPVRHGGGGGGYTRVVFEWGEVRRSGQLRLAEMGSVVELLEAVVAG